jgi:hypothetical protein
VKRDKKDLRHSILLPSKTVICYPVYVVYNVLNFSPTQLMFGRTSRPCDSTHWISSFTFLKLFEFRLVHKDNKINMQQQLPFIL